MSDNKKIAVIGIGCKYSGGINNPDSFWKFLLDCGDGVVQVPRDRWDSDKFYDPNKNAPGKMYVNRGAFIEEDIFAFDNAFFSISPRESKTLDPQQRILLETTFEAIEDAALDANRMKKSRTGVFVGGFMLDNFVLRSNNSALKSVNSNSAVAGCATLLANRISHSFDFLGPSLTVDTACSSSMVAVHLACHSLLNGDSDVAVAGGVNVILNPSASILMSKGQFLAEDGRSKAFFEDGDGYGRGEGSGVVVLKKLEDALADNDRIYSVIEATAVNQDGRTEGIALPNQESQKQVIREAIKRAGVLPQSVDYVEAHGTGTKAGDPMELGALGEIYGATKESELLVGSVKINIGHTEAAAGVAGIIKASLMLSHGQIVPHMNLGKLNPKIDFEGLNVRIPLNGDNWYEEMRPQRVAVNSFGYGGTNGHAILSRAPVATESPAPAAEYPQLLFPISGKTKESLSQNGKRLYDHLSKKDVDLNDLSYTLQRKTQLDLCWYLQASSRGELLKAIESKIAATAAPQLTPERSNKNVWVFTGMGPQWWGMGQQLYRNDRAFREKLESCDALYKEMAGYSLLEEMQRSEDESRITENQLAQPANFFIQVGLAHSLMTKGLKPDLIVGHSVGEVAATVISGGITLREGVGLIYNRGKIVQGIAGQGTLLAVGLGAEAAQNKIKHYRSIEIATINAPNSCALAGTCEDLAELNKDLQENGIFSKFVRVQVAYHSSQLEDLKENLLEAFSFVQPKAVKIPQYSTVTGEKVTEIIHHADYWWKNVRQQVFFETALSNVIEEGQVNFMEIGPHPVLGSCIKEIAGAMDTEINTFFTLKRKTTELDSLLNTLSQLRAAGVSFDFTNSSRGQVIDLPTYCWDKEWLWEENEEMHRYRLSAEEENPFLQFSEEGPSTAYRTQVNRPRLRYLQDHKVGSAIVLPGAGYIEMALSCLSSNSDNTLILENVRFGKALTFDGNEFPEIHISFSRGQYFEISSENIGEFKSHVSGKGRSTNRYQAAAQDAKAISRLLQDKFNDPYPLFEAIGLDYGEAFQTIKRYAESGSEIYSEIVIKEELQQSSFVLHPTLLDGAFQTLLLTSLKNGNSFAYLPVKIAELRLFKAGLTQLYCRGQIISYKGNSIIGDIDLIDPTSGEVAAQVKRLECRKVDSARNNSLSSNLYKYGVSEFKLPGNKNFEKTPMIFTGCLERYAQQKLEELGVFTEFEDLRFHQAPYQLIYLSSQKQDQVGNEPIREAERIVKLLQSNEMRQNAQRFVIVIENGLTDEFSYPLEAISPAHSSTVGLARVVMTEFPELECKLIDCRQADNAVLNEVLKSQFAQEELILKVRELKQGKLLRSAIAYPAHSSAAAAARSDKDQILEVKEYGKMDSLAFRDRRRAEPAADQVAVDVQCSSINFKDVMKTMGMLNEEALQDTYFGTEFGLEGAGIVASCGVEATDFNPGDRVYFFAPGLRSRVNCSAAYTFKLEDKISLGESATFFVYFTAWVALVEQARICRGEKILIHSAAGGVGLSAVYIAQAFGLEVYATAGTEEKRQFLRESGVNMVYDSRKLNFYDEILHDSKGGVDIVLNSLAGEALHKSFNLLKSMGRFVELGKQDITRGEMLSMEPFNKSVQFTALDLDKIMPLAPEMVRGFFLNFLESYSSGKLKPLPISIVPANNISQAVKTVSTGNHIGKIVIEFSSQQLLSCAELPKKFTFAEEELFIVTGGCSGFGLRSALWLAQQGCKKLVLASRRGYIPDTEKETLKLMRDCGVEVYCEALDVGDIDKVQSLISRYTKGPLRIKGILHAATVLEDAVIPSLTAEKFKSAFLPKALGAWNLHKATESLDLEYFIAFSSVTSYLGNPGQSAYAAANCFIDGLCTLRRSQGLNATSISWGSIGEVGILARNSHVKTHLNRIGLRAVAPNEGLELMGQALLNHQNHIGIIDIDWNQWSSTIPGSWERLSELTDSTGNKTNAFVTSLFDCDNEEEQLELIIAKTKNIVATVIGCDQAGIQNSTKLNDLGLDSIMAVELSIDLIKHFTVDIPVMEILGAGSVHALAKKALQKITQITDHEKESAVFSELDDYLQRICVRRPYVSLTEIKADQQKLGASSDFRWSDDQELNLAEAARHMALLGSCAAVNANKDKRRHCYPVKRGELKLEQHKPTTGDKMILNAKVESFDAQNSQCSALSELYTEDMRKVGEMLIDYHIIPEQGLYELFSDSINEDPSWQDPASGIYNQQLSLGKVHREGDVFFSEISSLPAEWCVGHFKNLPAFPVSIMTRFMGKLVRHAHQHLGGTSDYSLSCGICETKKFVFANSTVRFNATFNESSDRQSAYRGSVVVENEVVANFEFTLDCIRRNTLF